METLEGAAMTRRVFTTVSMLGCLSMVACMGDGMQPEPRSVEGSGADQRAATPPSAIAGRERATWYEACWSRFNDRQWDDVARCYADPATSAPLGLPPIATRRAEVLERARA